MLSLARTSRRDDGVAGTSYSSDQVYALLTSSHTEAYSFDWLSADKVYQGDLTPYLLTESPAQLSCDSSQAVSRSLSFRTRGKPAKLDPFNDLIRCHFRVLAADGGWLDWTIGTLALNRPRKSIREGWTIYDWTASDLTNWLVKDQFPVPYSVSGATDAIAGVRAILASFTGPAFAALIPAGYRSLAIHDSLSWDGGKAKLEGINALLDAVSYRPIWTDEQGDLRSLELPDYNQEVPSFTWDGTGGSSIVLSTDTGLQEVPDESNAFNYCEVIGEDPRLNLTGKPTPIFASYENVRPDSPISVPSLKGRRIVKVIKDTKIADQFSAQIRAKYEVQLGARVLAAFSVPTLSWPGWADGGYPLIHFPYSSTDEGTVDGNYLVKNWSWTLAPGGGMLQVLQRVTGV